MGGFPNLFGSQTFINQNISLVHKNAIPHPAATSGDLSLRHGHVLHNRRRNNLDPSPRQKPQSPPTTPRPPLFLHLQYPPLQHSHGQSQPEYGETHNHCSILSREYIEFLTIFLNLFHDAAVTKSRKSPPTGRHSRHQRFQRSGRGMLHCGPHHELLRPWN